MPDAIRIATDEELLPDPTPPPAVHYAEQALLGALLLAPERLKAIWPLRPEEFGNPAHSALFAAMCTLSPPAPEVHRTSPLWLNQLLDAAQPHARALTASYLHALISACPADGHAPAYAQMVRAGHARRLLWRHAGLLAQAATAAGPDPAAVVLTRADQLAVYLDELAASFPSRPGSLPRTQTVVQQAGQPSAQAQEEEQLLLGAVTAHPEGLPRMRWLHEGDLTVPVHAALFACLTALSRRGTPVDPVTLPWEAQQRGLLHAGFGPQDVLALVAHPVGGPEHWGQRVLQRALLNRAKEVAARITALTEDEATSVHQLATGSRHALAALSSVRSRWHQAVNGPTPGTPAASPPRTPAVGSPGARAGPGPLLPARPAR
ncbi:DnaB-like helicase N-terminal domain-containing protein [Streptomyces goshikiensis]|uniref:DnaB-like helicase N-terminal domain-containing protein n=1 Tax=Streptomyces goshikiensis TaxID=1942 RepID=UPI0037249CF7